MIASESDQTQQDSKLLYQLCCDVGFSLKQWKERLEVSDVSNTWNSYFDKLPGFTCLDSGSSSEGVGMIFLGSDIDVMHIIRGISVIEGNVVNPDESDHMFQMVKASHPAFVNVLFLSNGTPADESITQTLMYCQPNKDRSFVLNGERLKGGIQGSVRNGPAQTINVDDKTEMDHVFSLHCRSWPSASDEWIHRQRPFNWPSPDLIQQIVDSGCELVSVGSHRSAAPHLEWRLSSSKAEKCLVRTFNIYQIQCYFLLKLILTFLIKPVIRDKLCSYHMKTVMLHVVETTNPAIWRKDNLTNCFMICLHTLACYLHAGFCPQYFIPQHNLFDPKIQGESRRKLLQIVNDLRHEGWRCVLRCPPFNQPCQHPEIRCLCHIRQWENHRDTLHIWNVHHIFLFHFTVYGILSNQCRSSIETVNSLVKFKDNAFVEHLEYFPSREITAALQNHFKLTTGLVLLGTQTRYNDGKHHHRILYYAKQCVEEGKETPSISCKLKYATFLYMTGDTDRCLQVVHEILTQYEHGTISECRDAARRRKMTSFPEYRQMFLQIHQQCTDVTSILAQFVHPVVLSKWEIQAGPPGLQHVAETRQLVTEFDHKYSSLLFVDCLVYIHYLLFLCYTDMRKPAESRQSLDMLRQLAEHPTQHYICYPEIARLLYECCQGYRSGC